MSVAGGEQGRHYQKIVYHWFNSLSVQYGMFHDRCVLYVYLKGIKREILRAMHVKELIQSNHSER